jgi:hypothetical protein
MKKAVLCLIIFSLIFSPLCFAQKQIENGSWLEKILTEIKKVWKEEVLPFFQKIEKWGSKIWTKVESLFKKEFKTRTPEVKKEFQIKKEVIKKDLFQTFRKIKEKIFNSFKRE